MTEKEVFDKIYIRLVHVRNRTNKPVRIAINGVEGTGKTTFAENLTDYLASLNESVIHISIDGFHYNKKHRYRQGRNSAKGYYEDSYDEVGFIEKVLLASQLNPPTIVLATHDLATDEYLNPIEQNIGPRSFLITDGAYLFKPIYRPHWDVKIYLKTDWDTALSRGVERDSLLLGSAEQARDKFISRYHAASQIYMDTCLPMKQADIIIDNTDLEHLRWQRG